MDVMLLELKAKNLLAKFGAGDHKPGSGSAAANLGLLSAQLLRTVICLTDQPKYSQRYANALPTLKHIISEIDKRILPELELLFQMDSEQFDRAIKSRDKRNSEQNPVQKYSLIKQAIEDLKPATLTPIKIAELCIELADFAKYVFLHGFKSARGDAGVAQSAAIAAVGGCLSIIYLNLLSFSSDEWTTKIFEHVEILNAKHQKLLADAIDCKDILRNEAIRNLNCQKDINAFLADLPHENDLDDNEIENVAKQLQLLLWEHKDTIWKYNDINGITDVLQPDKAVEVIGYKFYRPTKLDNNTPNDIVIAGLIDKTHRYIQVSRAFEFETQNFTAAHELGHALLHNRSVLHRDKPLNGSSSTRDKIEMQADKFAAFFLMPSENVIADFRNHYKIDKFSPNQHTVFNFFQTNLASFRTMFKSRRTLSRYLATPLADMYNVSVEAMAIRLEELNLIEY